MILIKSQKQNLSRTYSIHLLRSIPFKGEYIILTLINMLEDRDRLVQNVQEQHRQILRREQYNGVIMNMFIYTENGDLHIRKPNV